MELKGFSGLVSIMLEGVVMAPDGVRPVKGAIEWLRGLIIRPPFDERHAVWLVTPLAIGPDSIDLLTRRLLAWGLGEGGLWSIKLSTTPAPGSVLVSDRAILFDGERFPGAARLLQFRSWSRPATDLENVKIPPIANMHEREREAVREALLYSGSNVTLAARALGVSRASMYRMMDRHDFKLDPHRSRVRCG